MFRVPNSVFRVPCSVFRVPCVSRSSTTEEFQTPTCSGLVYGYNQGMFGQILAMNSFARASGVAGIDNPLLSGLLTSILELGAWVGVLANGILADALGRKLSVLVASVIFCIGVVIQAATHGGSYDYLLAGRFVTGIGVGT